MPLFCSKLKRAMSNWIKLICREQELETSESSAAETVCLCIDARLDAECHLFSSNWSAFVCGWCLHVYPWWDECVMIKERHFQNGNTITHRHRYFYLSSPCMIVYVLCIVFFLIFYSLLYRLSIRIWGNQSRSQSYRAFVGFGALCGTKFVCLYL